MNTKKEHIDFYLIGMSNHSTPFFTNEVLRLIKSGSIFSGGKRHYQLVKSFLPENHQWIEISGDMQSLMNQYETIKSAIIVFVSGDPFFYGFGNTLQRLLPNAKLKSYPYFNSIQLLCQKTQTNYNELHTVSVHGRGWSALDAVLIQSNTLIGVLTDAEKSPNAIAKRMLQYGFDNYTITVGEALDGVTEQISTYNLQECKDLTFNALNCVLLKQTQEKPRQFGIEDTAFTSLPNRPNMITKMPIRLSTINALALDEAKVFWDIGSCTGAVAIEAKRHYPKLSVVAFEKREECKSIIQQNAERFSAPGIQIEIANFFNLDLSDYPTPDAVFIGGHGGQLKEMIHLLCQLNSSVKLVTNAVQESTSQTFIKELTALRYEIETIKLKVDNHNEIVIHKAIKK